MTCPICEGQDQPAVTQGVITVRGSIYFYDRHSLICQDCGFNYYSGTMLDDNVERRIAVEATIPHYISPSDILSIREQYMLSTVKAASYFQIPVSEWHAYESGGKIPEPDLSDLMKQIRDDHEAFVELVLASRPIIT